MIPSRDIVKNIVNHYKMYLDTNKTLDEFTPTIESIRIARETRFTEAEIIAHDPNFEYLSYDEITKIVCHYWGVNLKALKTKSRQKVLVAGRRLIFVYARKYTRLGVVELGRKFNRDHSTVITACEMHRNMIQFPRNTPFDSRYLKVSNKISVILNKKYIELNSEND